MFNFFLSFHRVSPNICCLKVITMQYRCYSSACLCVFVLCVGFFPEARLCGVFLDAKRDCTFQLGSVNLYFGKGRGIGWILQMWFFFFFFTQFPFHFFSFTRNVSNVVSYPPLVTFRNQCAELFPQESRSKDRKVPLQVKTPLMAAMAEM